MILFDEQVPHIQEVLGAFDDVASFVGRELTREHIITANAEAIVVRSTTRVDQALLADTPVKFVASATSGLDHVAVGDLNRLGIEFASSAGSNAWAVAEYVTAAIFELRDTGPLTIGIIGYGNVGNALTRASQFLGWRIVVSDPPLEEGGKLILPSGIDSKPLNELLAMSDVVSVHVPLSVQGAHATRGFLGSADLALLKQSSILINTSRGGVVDELALTAKLEEQGDIFRAVVDVYAGEPNPDSRLIELATIATPHIAGYTQNAKDEGAWMAMSAWARWKGIGLPERSSPENDVVSSDVNAALKRSRPIAEDSERFKNEWLADPRPETFDAARKEYPLRNEVLYRLVL